jgi:anaerobic magnesium-protoporphyrin IX monomethyl ester cyclase
LRKNKGIGVEHLMKILAIYPNAEGYFRIPIGLSIIITELIENDHKVELFDTTFMTSSESSDNLARNKAKLVIPVDLSKFYNTKTQDNIDEILTEQIKKFSPDLIIASIVEDNYTYADHLFQVAKSCSDIPILVGGATPTIAPDVVLENPRIDYLIQGEGEEAAIEFCSQFEQGKPIDKIRNVWYKNNGTIKHNDVRPYVNMDTLPFQNFDIWDKRHFMKPYCGKLVFSGFFEMSRGCMNKCTYCINYTCRTLLSSAGSYYRRKSIPRAIDEIKTLCDKYHFEMIFFCDDNFLYRTQSEMNEFSKLWSDEVHLPYWINTTVESINKNKLEVLKHTGCCGIGIGIESGNEQLRLNVLCKKGTNTKIKDTFNLIHEFGIRSTGNAMIGFPGETETDVFDTVKLFKEIKPKSYDLNFVAPYIGTAIYEKSKELGYIDVWDKPGFKGMAKNITTRKEPIIQIPTISRERLLYLFEHFVDYVEGRIQIPEEYI